jgi:hypothetical protein
MRMCEFIAISALILTTPANAAEGTFDHVLCYAGHATTIQHADGFASGIIDNVGTLNDPEGHPFHGLACRCLGTFTINAGDYAENGTCECANASNDKIFGIWARRGDPAKAEGTWHVVHGTGKFAGWKIDSKWHPEGNYPALAGGINGCNRDIGAYTSQ